MAVETITQIRANYPSVILAGTDLFLLDQTNRTIAATIGELAVYLRPGNATITSAGLMTSADKLKLNSIPANATANREDSFLLSRANHQGQQEISTVSGLGTRLSAIDTATQTNATAIESLAGTTIGIERLVAAETRIQTVEDWVDLEEARVADIEADVAALQAPQILVLKTFTLATLPDAALHTRGIIEVSDAAAGPMVCRSNGTDWLVLNTTEVVA